MGNNVNKWLKKYMVVVNRDIVMKTNNFQEALKCFNKHATAGNKYTNLINTTIQL